MPKPTVASTDKKVGTAGRRGDDVRSDLWVSVERRDKGGIELELRSRVESYYGDSIREQAASILNTLGLEHAQVEIEDQGALPFVIAARVEAAAVDAGIAEGADATPKRSIEPPPASSRDRMRRSRLYVPGNEPKYFINAGLHQPDGIILDLEDSVHAEHKPAARLLVRNALATVDLGGAERMVRINQLPLGLDDLRAVVQQQPDMILIPKVEQAEQVREAAAVVDEVLDNAGIDRPLWLMPILESALGIENALEIACASERVAALTIGLEDYAADIGVPRTAEGDESDYARRRLVNAARAAGVQAIDSVYGQVDDLDGLHSWGKRSKGQGFVGMGCVHPRQILPIHDSFNPTQAQIQRAQRIVAAFEKAQAAGLGVVSLGSKMIAPPVIKQSQQLVAQARAAGLLAETSEGDSTP